MPRVGRVVQRGNKYRSLAQLVEQLAFNQFVEGSNPSRPTTFLPKKVSVFVSCMISVVSSVGRAVGF